MVYIEFMLRFLKRKIVSEVVNTVILKRRVEDV